MPCHCDPISSRGSYRTWIHAGHKEAMSVTDLCPSKLRNKSCPYYKLKARMLPDLVTHQDGYCKDFTKTVTHYRFVLLKLASEKNHYYIANRIFWNIFVCCVLSKVIIFFLKNCSIIFTHGCLADGNYKNPSFLFENHFSKLQVIFLLYIAA
jgi:hypothetical protein